MTIGRWRLHPALRRGQSHFRSHDAQFALLGDVYSAGKTRMRNPEGHEPPYCRDPSIMDAPGWLGAPDVALHHPRVQVLGMPVGNPAFF